MNLYASGEDYLEAILVLYKKFGSVRSVDIARHMEVLSELYTLRIFVTLYSQKMLQN